jgi:hypothetical protein
MLGLRPRPKTATERRSSAGEGGGAGAGRRERLLGYSGQKQRRREVCSFFSKQILNWILNYLLNLIQTTQYKISNAAA